MTVAKPVAVAAIVLSLGGCKFGTLSTSECLELYAQGAVEAAAHARSAGAITQEGYGYCADGRTRIDATLAPLRAHGIQTSEPDNHFEVPGGWCVKADRPAGAHFDAMRSLEAVCAIGASSRAYLTGGVLTSSDGRSHYIRSTYDREAREALDKRLEESQP